MELENDSENEKQVKKKDKKFKKLLTNLGEKHYYYLDNNNI